MVGILGSVSTMPVGNPVSHFTLLDPAEPNSDEDKGLYRFCVIKRPEVWLMHGSLQ